MAGEDRRTAALTKGPLPASTLQETYEVARSPTCPEKPRLKNSGPVMTLKGRQQGRGDTRRRAKDVGTKKTQGAGAPQSFSAASKKNSCLRGEAKESLRREGSPTDA